MGAMSIGHWVIVFLVVMLVFGPKKLGDLGKSLGEGLKGFRDAMSDKEPVAKAGQPLQLAGPPKDQRHESST